jgi:chromate transporter
MERLQACRRSRQINHNVPAWLEVFARFLRLGLTSFGGPVAHLGYFRREFVANARWLGDAEFAEIVALCSVLPGPTSSQVGMTLGFRRAGPAGALAAWLAFTLPSALVLATFGVLLRASPAHGLPDSGARTVAGALEGLAGVAAAVVALAVVQLARNLANTPARRAIAAGAFAVALACARVSAALQWVPLLAGGIAGGAFAQGAALPAAALRVRIPARAAFIAGGVFALLLAGLPLVAVPGTLLALFATFFRAGALVFGGGHVVLPFLDGSIATGAVSERDFFAGYGVAQAVPGPLFTFAAFLGAVERAHPPVAGALVATLGIFAPSFLLLAAAFPLWNVLREMPRAAAVLAGFGAAVVGLLAAVLVTPLGTSLVHQPRSLCCALIALALLGFTRAPAWAVVLLGAALGSVLRVALRA